MFDFLKKKKEQGPAELGISVDQDALIERVVQALGVADDDTVLQVGFLNEAAIKRVLPLLTQGRAGGIERDPAKVRLANDLSPEAFRNFKLEFKEGVVSRIPYPAEYFSKVFALDSVGTWLSVPKGLTEISRVLCPWDGWFSACRPPAATWASMCPRRGEGLLQDAGFENIEVMAAPSADESVVIWRRRLSDDLRHHLAIATPPGDRASASCA